MAVRGFAICGLNLFLACCEFGYADPNFSGLKASKIIKYIISLLISIGLNALIQIIVIRADLVAKLIVRLLSTGDTTS